MELYSYKDLAGIFGVTMGTVRKWKIKGFFEILGYRRKGRWARQAVVGEDQVRALIKRVLLPPDSHPALKKNILKKKNEG